MTESKPVTCNPKKNINNYLLSINYFKRLWPPNTLNHLPNAEYYDETTCFFS
jgi:hypothetical protein